MRSPRRFGPLARPKQPPSSSSSSPPRRLPAGRPRDKQRQLQQHQRLQQQLQQGAFGSKTEQNSASASASSQQSTEDSAGPRHGLAAQPSSMAQPIHGAAQQQQQQRGAAEAAAAIQTLPGIGTWAGRYRLFGGPGTGAGAGAAPAGRQLASEAAPLTAVPAPAPKQQDAQLAGRIDGGGVAGGAEGDGMDSPVVLRPLPFVGESREPPPQQQQLQRYNSEEAQESAWRWRFSR